MSFPHREPSCGGHLRMPNREVNKRGHLDPPSRAKHLPAFGPASLVRHGRDFEIYNSSFTSGAADIFILLIFFFLVEPVFLHANVRLELTQILTAISSIAFPDRVPSCQRLRASIQIYNLTIRSLSTSIASFAVEGSEDGGGYECPALHL